MQLTVGCGDVVPSTVIGKVVGGIEMVLGVALITFLTTVIQRSQRGAQVADREHLEGETHRILEALAETRDQVSALDKRFDLHRVEALGMRGVAGWTLKPRRTTI